MRQDVTRMRSEAAEAAFQDYDMGDAVVVGTSGWEHDTHDAQVTRTIFVQDPEDPHGPSLKGHVNVDFADAASDVVTGIEAYVGDAPVGRPGGATPTP